MKGLGAAARAYVSVDSLSPGDITYIDGKVVGFNKKAEVVKINKEAGKVYVYFPRDEKYMWVTEWELIGWFDNGTQP